MMKSNFLLLCIVLIVFSSASVMAQSQDAVPACSPALKSQKFVGDRLRLPLPKNAIVKKGRDVDYSDYYIGFGEKKIRVWISGIFGPTATSGQVSKDWLSASSEISQRTWKFGEIEGVEAKGKLANGNYWRYFGQYGESIEYYDVPAAAAAAYFDKILDNLCYQKWK